MKLYSLLFVTVFAMSLAACPAPADPRPDEGSSKAAEAPAADDKATGDKAQAAEAKAPAAKPAPEVKPAEPEDPTAAWNRERLKAPVPAPPNVKKPPKGTTRTEAGVNILTIKPGDGGKNPTAASTVTVHYTGWTTNGRMFDSSLKDGKPAQFGLGGVIAGWTDGLQYMTRGETARLWIPESLAYKGKPGRPKGMLVFEIELLDF